MQRIYWEEWHYNDFLCGGYGWLEGGFKARFHHWAGHARMRAHPCTVRLYLLESKENPSVSLYKESTQSIERHCVRVYGLGGLGFRVWGLGLGFWD